LVGLIDFAVNFCCLHHYKWLPAGGTLKSYLLTHSLACYIIANVLLSFSAVGVVVKLIYTLWLQKLLGTESV